MRCGVQALHATARYSAADSRTLLQHVLLWQYLAHRNVMDLVAILFERRGAATTAAAGEPARTGPPASDGCFLTTLGVELIQEAMQNVRCYRSAATVVLCCSVNGYIESTAVYLPSAPVLPV